MSCAITIMDLNPGQDVAEVDEWVKRLASRYFTNGQADNARDLVENHNKNRAQSIVKNDPRPELELPPLEKLGEDPTKMYLGASTIGLTISLDDLRLNIPYVVFEPWRYANVLDVVGILVSGHAGFETITPEQTVPPTPGGKTGSALFDQAVRTASISATEASIIEWFVKMGLWQADPFARKDFDPVYPPPTLEIPKPPQIGHFPGLSNPPSANPAVLLRPEDMMPLSRLQTPVAIPDVLPDAVPADPGANSTSPK